MLPTFDRPSRSCANGDFLIENDWSGPVQGHQMLYRHIPTKFGNRTPMHVCFGKHLSMDILGSPAQPSLLAATMFSRPYSLRNMEFLKQSCSKAEYLEQHTNNGGGYSIFYLLSFVILESSYVSDTLHINNRCMYQGPIKSGHSTGDLGSFNSI